MKNFMYFYIFKAYKLSEFYIITCYSNNSDYFNIFKLFTFIYLYSNIYIIYLLIQVRV